MKILLIMLQFYSVGSAPFCAVDNFGNETCYYYTLEACQSALGTHICIYKKPYQ